MENKSIKMMSSVYYKINHQKQFLPYENAKLAEFKSRFFYELSSKNESLLNNNVSNLFQFLLTNYLQKSKDKIYLIYSLIDEFKRVKNIKVEDYEKISKVVCMKIIKRNYKMNFNFNPENVNDVCTLISFGLTSKKKFKFKKYNDLLQKLEKFNTFDTNIIKIFKAYNCSVPAKAPELPKCDIPNEILLLKYILQGIKHINLNLKNIANINILPFLLIILNFDWLFPFVFEVNLDLNYDSLQKDIDSYFLTREKNFYINYFKNLQNNNDDLYEFEDDIDDKKNELNANKIENNSQIVHLLKKVYEKNNSHIRPIIITNKNVKNNIENNPNSTHCEIIDENYANLLIKNENAFDAILCFFYMIKKINYLKSINIIMPNAFIKENFDLIKIRHESTDITNINIFEYISTISSINSFSMAFNSLEKKTFENILFIIQNNSNLRDIELNFFPFEELYIHNLFKIGEECDLFKKLKINNINQNDINIVTNKNVQKYLKQKLLEHFELNLEKLFLLFQTKRNVDKLSLILKLPSIFSETGEENEGYQVVVLKFVLNLIILLFTEKLYVREFKLSLPLFNFNNRVYPIIGEIFDKINLVGKNHQLKTLYFEAMIFKIYNIQNIIPYNLKNLFLGELDLETFTSFIQFYQSNEFLQNSQLTNLSISLNKTVVKYNECKIQICKFFSGKNPIKMEEIYFKCYFRIKRKNLYDLLKSANGNKIKEYIIQMKIDQIEKYKHIIEHKDFYYINDNTKKKIEPLLPMFKKYNFLHEKNNKIAKNIIKFLLNRKSKVINIIDI